MILVTIRHLPTQWNLLGRLQGRADIGIVTPDLPTQRIVDANRKTLSALGPFDRVLISTLRRTEETAMIYGYNNPCRDSLLDELDFGKYEGVQRTEFLAEIGETWMRTPQILEFGESIRALERRVRQFLEKHKLHKRILVFGHGAWCRALKSIHATGKIDDMNQISIENNEILVLDF